MKKVTRHSVLCGSLLVLAGCVGPVQIAPLPYAHPANPDAPAGQTPRLGSALDSPPAGTDGAPPDGSAAGGMDHSKMGPAGGTGGAHQGMKMEPAARGELFQCPMHADVRSDKPGRCPVCGMKLTETKGVSKHEEDHER